VGRGASLYARAVLAISVCGGCLASPPPSELVDPDGRGSPEDAGLPETCTPGEHIAGTAFNASPVDSQSACNVENVELRDDVPAGLDRRFGDLESSCSKWDEVFGACGCVGLDLGALYPVSEFVVRARPVDKGCSQICTSGCGSGHFFTAWTGSQLGTYILAENVMMPSDTMADYTVGTDRALRYVVVCRDLWGEDRDDVAVDSIEVRCQ
jgi:hypothetical protein